MARKLALLIGVSQYQDPVLSKLKAADSDVSELAKILQDPAMGGFDEVTTIFSEFSNAVRVAIGDLFAEKKKDDLLLLYFSGHGVLDENGRFYLAVTDTQHNRLSATGIPASFIRDEMDSCRSKRQVLVLDCCYSGAFARGKGAIGLHAITRATFEGIGGYGQVVLTASSATQYALEGDQVIGSVETSLFTHFLIEGLRTGQADSDRDGRITLNELYDYVYEHVRAQTPHQTPHKWEQAREGEELVIARSRYRPTDLPSDLRQAIESTIPDVREGAVQALGQLLSGSDKSLARLARGILKAMAKEDDSLRVRDAAFNIIKTYEETKTTKSRPRQDHAIPILPMPSPQKMPPSGPLPGRPKAGPASIVPNTSKRNWLLWGGIGTSILILLGVCLLGNFATRLFTIPPLDIPTSTLTAPTTETLASAQAVISLPTNTASVLATDTLVSPTLLSVPTEAVILPATTSVLPTSTLIPTILVPPPSNTPTVPATFTPISNAGKIVFASNQNGNYEIYVMNTDGSGLMNLTNNNATDSSPGWSPDGRRIVFGSNRSGNPEFYVMNADGSNPIRLTNNNLPGGNPDWSPDGTKITFYAVAGSDISSEEIYVMNADGSGLIRLTQNSSYDFDPTWSPDGTKIAFCSGRDGNPDIYVMNADGSGQMNLTNYGAFEFYPQWSPDGRKITFSSNRDGNYEIYVMNADGSGLMRLTQNSWVDHYASWSPDGRKIVFASSRDDPNPSTCADQCKYEIYVMNADGSGQIKLTSSAAVLLFPIWSP